MDPWGIAAIIGALALLVGVVVGGLLWVVSRLLDAKDKTAEAVEGKHAAELALLDATILSLRAELAEEKVEDTDGTAAAQGVVDAGARLSGAPDVELWRPAPDGATGAGGNAATQAPNAPRPS